MGTGWIRDGYGVDTGWIRGGYGMESSGYKEIPHTVGYYKDDYNEHRYLTTPTHDATAI